MSVGTDAGTDWAAMHRRLAVAEDDARTKARAERLFAERTTQLARRAYADRRELVTLVMLQVEGERFALRAAEALEVTTMSRAAVLPRAHPALLGIVDRRGVLCRVYDLASLCGMRRATPPTSGHLVVLRMQGGQLGLRVDRAETLIEADLGELVAGAETVPTRVGTYTRGGFTLLNCQAIVDAVDPAEAS